MLIRCLYDKLVPIAELKAKFHPDNPNEHSEEQIERLAKVLKYQGVRTPAKISNQTNLITSGHGRVLAAERAGFDSYPVNFQDYDNLDMEYSDLVADNALAEWSKLNLSKINDQIPLLGHDFEIELFGMRSFSILAPEVELVDKQQREEQENKKFLLEVQFPNDMEMMDIHDDLLSRGYIVKVK